MIDIGTSVIILLLTSVLVGLTGYLIGDFLATARYNRDRHRLIAHAATISGDLVDSIEKANPDRSFDNIHRRMIKLGEEFGEASQAYLSATSPRSTKKLTFADLREELADIVIVAVDLALTRTPDQVEAGVTDRQAKLQFMNMVAKKLIKWLNNRAKNLVVTDAE